MTRPLTPFWPFEVWSAWWEAWGTAPYVTLLRDSGQARALARIHATAFARSWDAHEFERMLCERSTGRTPSGRTVRSRASCCLAARPTRPRSSPSCWPRCTGRGLSHKLVSAHLEHLVQTGICTVHLEVDEGNAPALKLYARHGFRQVGERTGYYTRPDGSRATALTMTAVLA